MTKVKFINYARSNETIQGTPFLKHKPKIKSSAKLSVGYYFEMEYHFPSEMSFNELETSLFKKYMNKLQWYKYQNMKKYNMNFKSN